MGDAAGGGGGGGDPNNGAGPAPEIFATSAIRLDLPRFAENNINEYFTRLGHWFNASRVTSDAQKYSVVMASIPVERTNEVEAIAETAPEHGKYEFMKRRIIAYFADSQQKRLREALSDMQLGDMKPSQFYNKLKRLAGDSLTETALIELWAAQLPEMAHATVVQMKNSPLEDRLAAADALIESLRLRSFGGMNVNQATAGTSDSTTTIPSTGAAAQPIEPFPGFNLLINKITDLCKNNNNNERRLRNQGGLRSRSKSNSRRNRSESSAEPSICWYHQKFGDDADHCLLPCSMHASFTASSKNTQ